MRIHISDNTVRDIQTNDIPETYQYDLEDYICKVCFKQN